MKILFALTLIAFIAVTTAQAPCTANCLCPAEIRDPCDAMRASGGCVTFGPGLVELNQRLPPDTCVDILADTELRGNIISSASTRTVSNDCVFIGARSIVTGNIDLKGGEDLLVLEEFALVQGTVKMGREADCLEVTDGTTGRLDMGEDNDYIFAVGYDVRSRRGAPRDVILGAGNDCMDVTVNVKRSITSKKQISLNHFRDVFGGNGNDAIFINAADMRNMWGFNGDDCFVINDIRFRQLFADGGADEIRATNWDSSLMLTESVSQINGGKDIDSIFASMYNGINRPGRVSGGSNSAMCCVDSSVETRDCSPVGCPSPP